jgi:hypothetical protein
MIVALTARLEAGGSKAARQAYPEARLRHGSAEISYVLH